MGNKLSSIEEYDKMLQRHIDKKDLVEILRAFTEGEANIGGFMLDMSDDFLLLQMVEGFQMDGYGIIRKDYFEAMSCNDYNKAYRDILKAEGVIKKEYGLKKKVKLDTWKTIFKSLVKHDFHVIVECEDLQNPTFTIGPITKVGNKYVHIRYYDATGLLEKKSTKVKLEDITLVRFGDRYTQTFRKYLKGA